MNKKSNQASFITLVLAMSFLIGILYWMFSLDAYNQEQWDKRGIHSYATVTSVGYKKAYLTYTVGGKEYHYIKTLTNPSGILASRLQEGDTLEVVYLPEDPGNSWVSLRSWEKYHN